MKEISPEPIYPEVEPKIILTEVDHIDVPIEGPVQ